MSAQRYTDPVARQRMAAGTCPECGNPVSAHGGWGGPGCSLTDNGAAARIAQYQADQENAAQPDPPARVRELERTIELLLAYGTARFGDEWWPGNARNWMPDGRELEYLLDPGSAEQADRDGQDPS